MKRLIFALVLALLVVFLTSCPGKEVVRVGDFTIRQIEDVVITKGGNKSITIIIDRTDGFSDTVSLALTKKPEQVQFSPNPIPAQDSVILTLTVPASVLANKYDMTITGTAGSKSKDMNFKLIVENPTEQGFSIEQVADMTAQPGSSPKTTVNIKRTGGFSDLIKMTFTVEPATDKVTGVFKPDVAENKTRLLLHLDEDIEFGDYYIVIKGKGVDTSKEASVRFKLTVAPKPANIVAYAFADLPEPSSAYTPKISYNASGAKILVSQKAVGIYKMEVPGYDIRELNLLITSALQSLTCKGYVEFGKTYITISCFYQKTHKFANSAFSISLAKNDYPSSAKVIGFALADKPENSDYTITNASKYNVNNAPIKVKRLRKGSYWISFTDNTLKDAISHVSATENDTNSPQLCSSFVHDSFPDTVEVNCFDGDGNPVDVAFGVSVIKKDNNSPLKILGFSDTVAEKTFNSTGGTVEHTEPGRGIDSYRFEGLNITNASVQLSQVGGLCKIASYKMDSVNVKCYRGSNGNFELFDDASYYITIYGR